MLKAFPFYFGLLEVQEQAGGFVGGLQIVQALRCVVADELVGAF